MAININGTGSITGLSSLSSPTISGGSLPAGSASAPGLVFSGDSNTGIYSPGADELAISTNGTGRLFVDASGNVGASTSTINSRLHIHSTGSTPAYLRSTNDSTGTGSTDGIVIGMGDATNAYLWNYEAGSIVFATSASERLRITSDGKLGLGTSSPQRPFDVVSNSSAETATFRGRSSDNIGTIRFSSNDAGTNYATIQSRPAYFEISTSSSIPLVLAPGSGTGVGIGTTSITGFSDYTTVQLGSSSSGAAMRLVANGDTPGTDDFVIYKNTSGSYLRSYGDPLVFYGNSSEYGRWDTSGRLLVGTSSQSKDSTLVLEGSSLSGSNNESGIWMQRGTSSPADGDALGRIEFSDNTGDPSAEIRAFRDGGTWSASSKPGRLVFSTTADGASSPTERMRISNNGTLTCQGVFDQTTANTANVQVDAAGVLRRSTSSAKYKTDIETLQDSYADAILNVRPVWYRSTCEADNPNYGWWGFIAEEVAAIDPRLVHWKTVEVTYDENGSPIEAPCDQEPEGVQYDRFVPHLLNLIKRQGEAIAELQAEVAALKGA